MTLTGHNELARLFPTEADNKVINITDRKPYEANTAAPFVNDSRLLQSHTTGTVIWVPAASLSLSTGSPHLGTPALSTADTPDTPKGSDVMSDPTREEIEAKLETVQARTETRFAELSGKLDRINDTILALSKQVTGELNTVKSDNKFTRNTVIVAVVASVIAGISALWVTQANLLSAFQLGLTIKTEQQSQPSAPPKASNPK